MQNNFDHPFSKFRMWLTAKLATYGNQCKISNLCLYYLNWQFDWFIFSFFSRIQGQRKMLFILNSHGVQFVCLFDSLTNTCAMYSTPAFLSNVHSQGNYGARVMRCETISSLLTQSTQVNYVLNVRYLFHICLLPVLNVRFFFKFSGLKNLVKWREIDFWKKGVS